MDRFLLVFMMLASMSVSAKQEIVFTPLTPVAFTMTKKDVAIVTYSIRNNTTTTKKLNVTLIKGMKVLKGDGYCGVGMVLLSKKNCTLSLQLTGSELQGSIHDMPFLCTPDLAKCYYALSDDQMYIILKD